MAPISQPTRSSVPEIDSPPTPPGRADTPGQGFHRIDDTNFRFFAPRSGENNVQASVWLSPATNQLFWSFLDTPLEVHHFEPVRNEAVEYAASHQWIAREIDDQNPHNLADADWDDNLAHATENMTTPAPAPTNMADIMLALGQLTQGLQTLTKQVTSLADTANIKTASVLTSGGVEKPPRFKGDTKDPAELSVHARTFLSSYDAYARGQPNLTPGGVRKDEAWIRSFLSFMDGPAGAWAVPFKEMMGTGKPVFGQNSWDECTKSFKERFAVVSAEREARSQIQHCKQGSGDKKKTIAAYVAEFNAIAALTTFNDEALVSYFLIGLNQESRDLMIQAGISTEERLADIQKKLIERDKLRQDVRSIGKTQTATASTSRNTDTSVPMEIDATGRKDGKRTRFDFMRAMKGKCFRCGESGHTATQAKEGKVDCKGTGKICSYCKRRDHLSNVCQDRYMGVEQNRGLKPREDRKGKSTIRGTEIDGNPPDYKTQMDSGPSEEEKRANDMDFIIASIKESKAVQKNLEAQMKTLMEGFQ